MKATVTTVLSQLKSHGFTYEYFHGPSHPAREQNLAQSSHDKDMAGVVKEITYGDLWGGKKAAAAEHEHGPPSWLTTAYEGLVHFH
eukprot:CAMPEP_0113673110 /NCGR_PEP_ID=MMETSP0038_2-20120614/6669_1 /TAXON_ID=2898 /ORGANISM="Cryptomonas paramecium" /LENGTH=85 /DNA_ID=CAMNT_0000589519 /DNA_START=26 /DNA_END=283 /DNA_ORIENTATION=- /assembly_acc=CAM_ASM_000170